MAIFRIENYDATDTLMLLDGAGIQLMTDSGWSWHINPNETEVVNVYRFRIQGDTVTDIMTNFNSLMSKLNDARRWLADATDHRTYWLRFSVTGETAKRALIKSFEANVESNPFQSPLLEQNEAGAGIIVAVAMTMSSVWEDVSDTALNTTGTTNTIVRLFSQSAAAGGTDDGRITDFLVETNDLAALSRIWAGIKPNRATQDLSTLDYFWSGTTSASNLDTDDTTYTASTYYVTDFSTDDSLKPRVGVSLSKFDGSETWADLAGRYRVLLRYRIDDGSTECDARLSIAAGDFSGFIANRIEQKEPVPLSSTGVNIDTVDLGEVQLPPSPIGQFEVDEFDFSNLELVIEAGRVSGAGAIRFYTLILIPAEHFFYVDLGDTDLTQGFTGSAIPKILVRTLPTGENVAYFVSDFEGAGVMNPYNLISPEFQNWSFPREGGTIVIHGAQSNQSTNADQSQILIEGNIRKRWIGYHD